MDLSGLDAIIFDFDGVLVESVNVKTHAFASLYAEYGDAVVADVEKYHLNNGGIARFDKFRYFQTEILKRPPLTDSDVADLADAFSVLVTDQVVAAPMVNGAREFLETAGRQVRLFVVSGTPTSELKEIISRRNLGERFAGVWGSPGSKSENIAELLSEHALSPGRCVMMGDALADYEGAVSNAVHFLGRVAENTANLFASDVKIFADFSRLPDSWR